MTKEQFDNQAWHKGMMVRVFGHNTPRNCHVAGIDFNRRVIRTEDITGKRRYVSYMTCIVIGE